MLKQEFKDHVEKLDLMDDTVEVGAFSNVKSIKTYGFDSEPKSYLIDAFSAIGWTDPFPKPMNQGKYSKPKVSGEKIKEYLK